MLLNNRNFHVRVSVEHLDPALYDALQAGDELVLYERDALTRGRRGDITRTAGWRFEQLRAIFAVLGRKKLKCLESKTPTCLVWEIVPDHAARARVETEASAAE